MHSNGSGKTSLAMATLWCLTGSLDARPLEDSKVADLVNDASKAARVTVRGRLNDVSFTITRTKTASKSGLVFLLGEKDMTAQSAKETQVLVEEILGVNPKILARTMFHGQHALNDLLEATDTALKNELSLVVPLEIWQEAVSIARKRDRAAAKRADELQGMLALRSEDMERMRQRLQDQLSDVAAAEKELEQLSAVQPDSDAVNTKRLVDEMISVESSLRAMTCDRDKDLRQLRDNLATLVEEYASANAEYDRLQNEQAFLLREESTDQRNLQKLETFWNLDLSTGLPDNIALPETCPTCQQPLTASGAGHSHKDLRGTIVRDVQEALNNLHMRQSELAKRNVLMEQALKRRNELQATLGTAQMTESEQSSYWSSVIGEAEDYLATLRAAYRESISNSLTPTSASASIETLRSLVNSKQLALERLQAELEEMERTVNDMQLRKNEQDRLSATLAELAVAMGPRGVQTFLLQNAVALLQSTAQSYLNELSDGSLRLELDLDAGDRISRRALVRDADGLYRERPLAALSGGQWRRCSLSLALGFAELVARRGQLRTNLLVLDEPLTHLDRSGRAEVGRTLRRLIRRSSENNAADQDEALAGRHSLSSFSVSTIIMILQDLAAEELEEAFDCMDEVVKEHGTSIVRVDEKYL